MASHASNKLSGETLSVSERGIIALLKWEAMPPPRRTEGDGG